MNQISDFLLSRLFISIFVSGTGLFVGSSTDIGVTSSFVGKLKLLMPETLGADFTTQPYQALLDTYTIEARSVNGKFVWGLITLHVVPL